MHLLYLDASGTPELQDNSKHYVLMGLSIHESIWHELNERLDQLKQSYGYPGQDLDHFELHVKQFNVSIQEQDEIEGFESLERLERRSRVFDVRKLKLAEKKSTNRISRYRDTEPYIHLTRAERSMLLEEAIAIIAGCDTLRLFCYAINKEHPGAKAGNFDLREEAFTQVVSRFDAFLQRKAKWQYRGNRASTPDHGLLMLDHDPSTQSVVEPLFKRFRTSGHPFGQMLHVIDVPFFASSEKVSGLQLADVAAYVVRRYLDGGSVPGSVEEQRFRQIFQRFDRDAAGNLHGLRHRIPANTCQCMICKEVGHSA
jgi:Protein of unknown function (DUF3800)